MCADVTATHLKIQPCIQFIGIAGNLYRWIHLTLYEKTENKT